MTTPAESSAASLRVSVTAPWRFYPREWWRYWRPRRITASFRDRHVYRWLVFNIAPKGWPTR